MLKNQFVQMLVELQKKGINVWLSKEGAVEFLRLMKNEAEDFFEQENVG